MSEENVTTDSSDEIRKATDPTRIDHELQALTFLANRGIGLPVTLSLGGRVVSGHLCGGDLWFDAVAEQLEAVADERNATDVLAQNFRETGEMWRKTWKSQDDPDRDLFEVAFVHMTNARTLDGRHLGPWRGRLAMVSDWSLGALWGEEG